MGLDLVASMKSSSKNLVAKNLKVAFFWMCIYRYKKPQLLEICPILP
uniref:Uncharacterized protein n=1 Tax=Rhizophora mucronata TaxID=61149 RepID=A0A2P2KQ32_RHIMU